MTVAQILNLRSEWEELVNGFKMNGRYDGTINNLKWFIQYGHTNNRFREGYEEAKGIAKTILSNYKNVI